MKIVKIEKDNLLVKKSVKFSLRIIELVKLLKKKNEFIFANQILRSGTSIGANIEESQGGFSRKDFALKLSISYKESRETIYWLKLLGESNVVEMNYMKI